jgi:hypothetical protein
MVGERMVVAAGMISASIGILPAGEDPGTESGTVVGVAVAVGAAGLDKEGGKGVGVEIRGTLSGKGAVLGSGHPVQRRHSLGQGHLPHLRALLSRPRISRPVRDSGFGLCPLFMFRRCDTVGRDTDTFIGTDFLRLDGLAGLAAHVAAGAPHGLDVTLDGVETGADTASLAAALLAADQSKLGKTVQDADDPAAADFQSGG